MVSGVTWIFVGICDNTILSKHRCYLHSLPIIYPNHWSNGCYRAWSLGPQLGLVRWLWSYCWNKNNCRVPTNPVASVCQVFACFNNLALGKNNGCCQVGPGCRQNQAESTIAKIYKGDGKAKEGRPDYSKTKLFCGIPLFFLLLLYYYYYYSLALYLDPLVLVSSRTF